MPPPSQSQKRTLLIVDDEEGPRQSLRVVFKDDYNLLMANDGLDDILISYNILGQNHIDRLAALMGRAQITAQAGDTAAAECRRTNLSTFQIAVVPHFGIQQDISVEEESYPFSDRKSSLR